MSRPLTALLALLLATADLFASAPPWAKLGTWAGEPEGLDGVAVTRRQLTIDLRSSGNRGTVTLRYEVTADQEGKRLEMVFALERPAADLSLIHI